MNEGSLHRLVAVFQQAFRELGIQAQAEDLEGLAVFIHRAMTVQTRHYHTLEHVLTFVEASNPVQTLAGLFHDTVYYQVDLGFLPEIEQLISAYIHRDGETFQVAADAPPDALFNLALEAFGLERGQLISVEGGLNEFLSTVVMNFRLARLVPLPALSKIGVCIEATIPFRGPAEDGRDSFRVLDERLRSINARWALGMTESEITNAIRQAVTVANKDVESFADPDAASFLANTWRLLPELNVPLRSRELYTIREYREALQRMEAFFRMVNPRLIFHCYDGVPDNAEFERLTAAAQKNVRLAWRYVSIKLLAQGVLESLAEETGGDAPLSLFMGEAPFAAGIAAAGNAAGNAAGSAAGERRLENFLPPIEIAPWVTPDDEFHHLLEVGPRRSSGFGMNTSPLSLFIYRRMSPEQIERAMRLSQEVFAGRLSHAEFLRQIGRGLVAPIARASAAMVSTRREKLLRFTQ
jgi:hypothetical protein